jgi:Protein of unknown function (DUF2568)
MSSVVAANIGLRAVMEGGIVAAFAYWGSQQGNTVPRRTLLALVTPTVAFGIWGAVDFHQLGHVAEVARLGEELAISALAALALYSAGERVLGIALAAASATHHALVYATGEHLLTASPASPQ